MTDDCTDRIKFHYRRLGLDKGWNRDRFYRLCQLLHCTEWELATLCGIFKPAQLRKWLKRNSFPPYVSLHFALIESAYLQAALGLERVPTMPIQLICHARL